jgi:hypothetical protein
MPPLPYTRCARFRRSPVHCLSPPAARSSALPSVAPLIQLQRVGSCLRAEPAGKLALSSERILLAEGGSGSEALWWQGSFGVWFLFLVVYCSVPPVRKHAHQSPHSLS